MKCMKKLVLFIAFLIVAIGVQAGTIGPMTSIYTGPVNGASGSSGYDFIIAASDSPQSWKSRADAVCDGTDDHLDIQAVLGEGVKALLAPGTFYVDYIVPPDNCILAGSGMHLTVLMGQDPSNSIIQRKESNPAGFEAYDTSITAPMQKVVLRDMQLNGKQNPVSGSVAISSISGNGTTVTVDTASVHGLTTNDYIRVFNTTGFDTSIDTVQVTVTDTDTFTYAGTATGLESSGYIIKPAATNGGAKGTFFQWMQDCTFERLYVVNTPSSGLGNDNHQRVWYIDCVTENCGTSCKITGAGDEPSGCSGFGLGCGGFGAEEAYVDRCISKGNWNSGYTWEVTPDGTYDFIARYYIYTNCTANGNSYGFRVQSSNSRGNRGVKITNCTSYGNKEVNASNGVTLGKGGTGLYIQSAPSDVILANNYVYQNEGSGLYVDDSNSRNLSISNNIFKANSGSGARIDCGSFVFNSNVVSHNGERGVFLFAPAGGIKNAIITDNIIWNNGVGATTYDGFDLQHNSYVIDGLIFSNNRVFDERQATSISSISGDGTTVTVITSTIHNLVDGDRADITGTVGFNTTNKAVTIVNNTVYTYADTVASSEATGTSTRVGSQDRAMNFADVANITSFLISGNVMRGNLRSSLASTSWSNADVTFVDNLTD